jgi:hypothetical protein
VQTSKGNPPGTMFVELIAELMDLVKNRDVSRIEVVTGSYDLDDNGKRKLANGKESVTTRSFPIRTADKSVQDRLRTEIEAGPFSLLMVLWIDRTQPGVPLGMLFFDAVGKKRSPGITGMDHLEKSVMAGYLNRQVK